MSKLTPLQIFSSIWTAQVSAIPYYNTVNESVDTADLPDTWGSAVYQPALSPDVTLGSRPIVEEQGIFLVALFTRSASGPTALDVGMEEIRLAFQGAAKEGLHCTSVDGPHDVDPETDGEWWRLVMTVNYTYQWRRAPSGPLYAGWEGFDTPAVPQNG